MILDSDILRKSKTLIMMTSHHGDKVLLSKQRTRWRHTRYDVTRPPVNETSWKVTWSPNIFPPDHRSYARCVAAPSNRPTRSAATPCTCTWARTRHKLSIMRHCHASTSATAARTASAASVNSPITFIRPTCRRRRRELEAGNAADSRTSTRRRPPIRMCRNTALRTTRNRSSGNECGRRRSLAAVLPRLPPYKQCRKPPHRREQLWTWGRGRLWSTSRRPIDFASSVNELSFKMVIIVFTNVARTISVINSTYFIVESCSSVSTVFVLEINRLFICVYLFVNFFSVFISQIRHQITLSFACCLSPVAILIL